MRCQVLFSRRNKKNISKCHLLKFLPSMQNVEDSNVSFLFSRQQVRLHHKKERYVTAMLTSLQ